MIKDIDNIAIILVGLMGDVVMRTPIIKVLKDFYPNSKITLFVDPIGKEVFKNNPLIDKIYVMDRKKDNRLNYIKEKIKAQVNLLKLKPDLVLDLYGGSSAKNMLKLNFAKYKVGFDNWKVYANKDILKYPIKVEDFKNPYHLTNKVFSILSFLPIEIDKLSTKPIIFTNPKIDKKMKSFMDSISNNSYLISLGSGGKEKILSLEKNVELIKYIYEKYNLLPMIIKNPGQEYLQEELINLLKSKNINHIKLPIFSLEEIVSLMKYSKFIIVPDTGLFHIAIGVGTPVFTIFTYTNPKLVEPESGIYGLCYKEIEKKDNFGLNLCTKDIKIEEIKDCFDKFFNHFISRNPNGL